MKKSSRQRRSVRSSRPEVRRSALRIERLENRVVFAGDAPQAINDLYQVSQDEPLAVASQGVLANDFDAELEQLAAELFSGPQHGSLNLRPDGSFDYQPNAGFTGLDSFLYRAFDGDSYSRLGAVTLRVNQPINHAPIAAADAFTTAEDATLDIPAAGILANDSDVDGDALSAVLVTGPQNGTLTLNADGSFSYTPNADFHGVDGFSYRVNDGSLDSNVANVTIEVAAVNDLPIAAADAFTTAEDATLEIPAAGILANDFDVDGDALSAILVTGPQNGTLTLNADGSFSYTPNADFHGVDGFSYVVNDGTADSDVASVTIEVTAVNDGPVAVNDAFTTAEDATLEIPAAGILANDSDVDGDALSAVLVTGPQNGTLTLNADGSFSYTPNADFHGVDGFSYVVNDGTADSDVASVTIEVTAVNDGPVAVNDAFTTAEDATLEIPAAGILANDSDVDGDALSGPCHRPAERHADAQCRWFVQLHPERRLPWRRRVQLCRQRRHGRQRRRQRHHRSDCGQRRAGRRQRRLHHRRRRDARDPRRRHPRQRLRRRRRRLDCGPRHRPAERHADAQRRRSFSYTPNADFHGVDGFSYVVNDGTADTTSPASP
ncbi:MAG: Ig-like domain-containing protein [Pirellulales bacterium]